VALVDEYLGYNAADIPRCTGHQDVQ
jgi:hypothetical protein